MDYAEKMQKCHEYVEALEEERRKIQVFQRELPLCLELVTQAIEACKRELSTVTTATTEYMHGQSDSSEETSSDRPVLEEFIPIKRIKSSSDNGEEDDDDNKNNDNGRDEQQSHKRNSSKSKEKSSGSSAAAASDHKRKSDWLRSVQLWGSNESPDPPSKEELPRKAVVTEVKRNGGGAFQPFHREKISAGKSNSNHHQAVAEKAPSSVPTSATSSSTAETGGTSGGGGGSSSKKEEKEGQTQKKQRRCWSPELHRRFLHALQQLGGSHVATPKQIRDLMKVDGLTNDEVKSHLQKYRLHTRRPTPAVNNNSNPPQPAPQYVVVGSIWVPPPEYAAVAATTASGETTTIAPATNTIYAPVAAAPPSAAVPKVSTPTTATTTTTVVHKPKPSHSDHLQSERRGSHSEGGVQSNSPSTSSSTHTTTTTSQLL